MTTKENEIQSGNDACTGISIRNLLIEVASIVIGVLLALAVDQWNEDRNHLQNANAALINIKKELGTNFDLLEIIHHNNTTVYSNSMLENSAGADNGGFVPGFQLPQNY